jgi:hypothetical protein
MKLGSSGTSTRCKDGSTLKYSVGGCTAGTRGTGVKLPKGTSEVAASEGFAGVAESDAITAVVVCDGPVPWGTTAGDMLSLFISVGG